MSLQGKRGGRGPEISLLERVEDFLERTGMAPSRFGLIACGDGNLCFQLAQGREPRAATVRAIDDAMRRHGPKAIKRRRAPSKPRRSPKPSRDRQARHATHPSP